MSESHLEQKLYNILINYVKKEDLIREYRFDQLNTDKQKKDGSPLYRKWKFDFAVPKYKIAFEAEGGIWNKGRHINPKGFISDCEKYNSACIQGWKVFRLPEIFINRDYVENLILSLDNVIT